MIFTVIWLPATEQELAALWLDATTRSRITVAADNIDRLLRRNADQVGESREKDQRILFEDPLAVLYRVKEQDRLVEVIHVWKYL
jgi:hypothetical protein